MNSEELRRAVKVANNPAFWNQVYGPAYLFPKEIEEFKKAGVENVENS